DLFALLEKRRATRQSADRASREGNEGAWRDSRDRPLAGIARRQGGVRYRGASDRAGLQVGDRIARDPRDHGLSIEAAGNDDATVGLDRDLRGFHVVARIGNDHVVDTALDRYP